MGLIGKNKTTEQIRKGLLGTIARIYLFKINNGNARTMYDICSKLTIETPKRRHCIFLVSLLLNLRFYILFWSFHRYL